MPTKPKVDLPKGCRLILENLPWERYCQELALYLRVYDDEQDAPGSFPVDLLTRTVALWNQLSSIGRATGWEAGDTILSRHAEALQRIWIILDDRLRQYQRGMRTEELVQLLRLDSQQLELLKRRTCLLATMKRVQATGNSPKRDDNQSSATRPEGAEDEKGENSHETGAFASVKPSRMTRKEAARRMEQLRLQGVQFTSQHDLAESFECSPSTINRAIKQTPTLQVWAKQPDAAPRVVGQTRNEKQDEVSRAKPFLSRELTPDDQAAINEYLDRKDHPEGWKEFFGGLLSQTQLEFINNPKRLKSLQAMYRKKVGDAKSE